VLTGEDPTLEFATALTSGEPDRIEAALSEDVRFSCPAVHKPYVGRMTVLPLLLAARRDDSPAVRPHGVFTPLPLMFRAGGMLASRAGFV